MAFNNQTRPTEVAKQQEKQKACERPNMEKVCGVGCHMITEKKNNAWREEEGVWVGGGMHWMRWGGGLVAPWECLATPTTFSRSCRSRWRPVISVLSLSSEGPDNQWALLGEAGANPLTPHPTPPPSADACVCVCVRTWERHTKSKCVCLYFGGLQGGLGPQMESVNLSLLSAFMQDCLQSERRALDKWGQVREKKTAGG